jgi:hypothetical protein
MKRCQNDLHDLVGDNLLTVGRAKCRACRRASNMKYNATRKRRETRAKYDAKRIQVRCAGTSTSIQVPPEHRGELLGRLAEFRSTRPFLQGRA